MLKLRGFGSVGLSFQPPPSGAAALDQSELAREMGPVASKLALTSVPGSCSAPEFG